MYSVSLDSRLFLLPFTTRARPSLSLFLHHAMPTCLCSPPTTREDQSPSVAARHATIQSHPTNVLYPPQSQTMLSRCNISAPVSPFYRVALSSPCAATILGLRPSHMSPHTVNSCLSSAMYRATSHRVELILFRLNVNMFTCRAMCVDVEMSRERQELRHTARLVYVPCGLRGGVSSTTLAYFALTMPRLSSAVGRQLALAACTVWFDGYVPQKLLCAAAQW